MLAAGQSSRMGSNKLLLTLGDKTLIEHAVRNALDSRIDEVIVVVGHQAERVKDVVPELDRVMLVNNPSYKNGMSSSIRSGLAKVSRSSEAVVILLADQPFVNSRIINALIDKFKDSGVDIVASRYMGEPRNPILFSRSLFPAIARLEGDRGARDLAVGGKWKVEFVDLDTGDYLRDLDTPADVQSARTLSGKMD